MLFASVSDVILYLLVLGYAGNLVLNKVFGESWAQQFGDYLRHWCATRPASDEAE